MRATSPLLGVCGNACLLARSKKTNPLYKSFTGSTGAASWVLPRTSHRQQPQVCRMSSPATDEQITALDDKLLNYPQSTSAEAGASPDMKRFLYAQQQLAEQGKARTRAWPKNKSTCVSHHQLLEFRRTSHQPTRYLPCAGAHSCRRRWLNLGRKSRRST